MANVGEKILNGSKKETLKVVVYGVVSPNVSPNRKDGKSFPWILPPTSQ
jgi:hypothetical protein